MFTILRYYGSYFSFFFISTIKHQNIDILLFIVGVKKNTPLYRGGVLFLYEAF